MKNSKLSILLLFLVMILAISAVSAADTNETSDSVVQAADEAPVDEVASADVDALAGTDDAATLSAGDGNNFTALQSLVDNPPLGRVITLNKDYTRVADDEDISIDSSITIIGNNYKIDAQNLGGIFNVKAGGALTLLGVTLVNGNSSNGGAIYNEGNLIIQGCTLTDNTASENGGAIYNKGNIDYFDDNILNDNKATNNGGAIYSTGALSISDSEFNSNKVTNTYNDTDDTGGSQGGAIYVTGDKLEIISSSFTGNTATPDDHGEGAAIYAEVTTTTISGTTFKSNRGFQGGAVKLIGVDQDSLVFNNCTFDSNIALQGGAIDAQGCANLRINDTIFKDNQAYSDRYSGINPDMGVAAAIGAAYVNDIIIYVNNSKFIHNTVTSGPKENSGFGAAIVSTGSLIVDNTEFINNEADKFATLRVYNDGNAGTVTITNSNFTGNKANKGNAAVLYSSASKTATIDNCKFEDNEAHGNGVILANGITTIKNSEFTNNAAANDTVIYANNKLTLQSNTITSGAIVLGTNGEVVTEINVVIANNGTITNIGDEKVLVNASITDDNGNKIANAEGFKFVFDGAEIDAIYDATDKLYYANLTMTFPGIYTVNMTYAEQDKLKVKTATLVNQRGTFADLKDKVTNAQNTLDLEYNFAYTPELGDTLDTILIPNGLTIDGHGSIIDARGDSINIFTVASVNTATLKNMVITGVNRVSTANYGAVVNHGTLTIDNCTFKDNAINKVSNSNGGAAVFNNGAALTIISSKFINNTAPWSGSTGAVSSWSASGLLIKDSYFEANVARFGGAVEIESLNQQSVAIQNCTFYNNTGYQGGALDINDGAKYVNVTGCTFDGNSFHGPAGDPTTGAAGGAICAGYNSIMTVEISNSIIKNNYGDDSVPSSGAGIRLTTGVSGIIKNCTFENNYGSNYSAISAGTIVDLPFTVSLTVDNCTFSNNNAPNGITVFSNKDVVSTIENCDFSADNEDIAIATRGALSLNNNTVSKTSAKIMTIEMGTITSNVIIKVLNDGTAYHFTNITLQANVTDDNHNPMILADLNLTVNDTANTQVKVTYNPATGLHEGTYTPIEVGKFNIGVNYITTGQLDVTTANITIARSLIDIQNMINAASAGDTITLDGDYAYIEELDSSIKTGIVVDKTLTIDGKGYTISGSNAAGILNVNCDGLTIKNTTFINASAQYGAIRAYMGNTGSESVLAIENCHFANNTGQYSGAIHAQACILNVTNSTFEQNKALYGGAIYVYKAALIADNCTFTENQAINMAGKKSMGGAILAAGKNAVAIITNSVFTKNTAQGTGGAVAINPSDNGVGSSLIDNCTFEDNVALTGGAVYVSTDTNLTINDSRFTRNIANNGVGGAIYIVKGNTTVTGSNFTDNSATVYGGAIVVSPYGDCLEVNDSRFNGNTANNTANSISQYAGELKLARNTIVGDEAEIIVSGGKIISTIKVIVLDGEVKTIDTLEANLYAKVTDDTGINLIKDAQFKFTINDEEVPAVYDNGLYKVTYPLPSAGIYPVNITYVTDDKNLEVQNGTIRCIKGTFTELASLVAGTGATLQSNFAYVPEIDGETYINGIVIDHDVVIDGNGTIISGNNAARIFNVANGATLTLSNATLTNGNATNGSAINSNGNLELNGVTFSDNVAVDCGGAIYNNKGTVIIEDCVFDKNDLTNRKDGYTKDYGGAAIYSVGGTLKINGSKFTNNLLNYYPGVNDATRDKVTAAITSSGVTVVNNTAFENNSGTYGADLMVYKSSKITDPASLTIDNSNFTNTRSYAGGIQIAKIDFNITNSNFDKNIAYGVGSTGYTAAGGAIDARDCNDGIIKDSNFTNCGNTQGGAVNIQNTKSLLIDGCIFENNTVSSSGGAVCIMYSAGGVTITNTDFINNNATNGGAVYYLTVSDNKLTISDCEFKDNYARDTGAAVYTVMYPEGNLDIINSNFTNNNAVKRAGAVFFGTTGSDNELTISNSKFTDNGAATGEAIYTFAKTVTKITDSTFTNNGEATDYTIYNKGTLELTRTTVDNLVYSSGTFNTELNATFLNNKTWNDTGLGDIYILNATLTDKNGNKIYDPNFRFAVNGENITDILYNKTTGLYTTSYLITTAGLKVISTNYQAAGLVIYPGALDIELANVTEFTVSPGGQGNRIPYGENVTVYVGLYGVNDEGLNETFTVVVNNTEYTVTVVNGTGSFNVSGLEPGDYSALAIFDSNPNYNKAYATGVFSVLRPDRTLSIAVENVEYGEIAIVNITINKGEESDIGVVVLNINGTEYTVSVEGNASIEIPGLPVGTHVINATLLADGLDDAVVNDTVNITVADDHEVIVVAIANKTISYGENLTVEIDQIISSGLEKVITGNATIYIYDGDDSTVEPVIAFPCNVGEDGVAVDFKGLSVGNYMIIVDFDSADGYYAGQATTYATVTKAQIPTFIVETTGAGYGSNATINVTIIGVNGEYLNGTAYITINSELVDNNVTIENGKFVKNVTADAGTYTVNVYFVEAKGNYEDTSSYDSFEIIKTAPTLDVNDTEVVYGKDIEIPFTITGVNGEGIDGTVLAVISGPEEYGTVVYDKNTGKGTISFINLKTGEQKIFVTFLSNDGNYLNVGKEISLNVTQANITIDSQVTSIDSVFGIVNATLDVTGLVNGDTLDAVVYVSKDGKELYNFSATLGEEEYIIFFGLMTPGVYNYTIAYDGMGDYAAAEFTKGSFTIEKVTPEIELIEDEINITIGGTAEIEYRVSPLVISGNVTLWIDDEEYYNGEFNGTTGSILILADYLNVSKAYNIKVQYIGDDKYNNSNVAELVINVAKIDVADKITIEGSTVTYGENGTITLELPDVYSNASGTVTVELIGVDGIWTVNLTDGYAVVEIPGLAGNATYSLQSLVYSGDDYYEGFTINDERITIEVKQAKSSVVIKPIEQVAYGNNVTIEYTVLNATTIKINVATEDLKPVCYITFDANVSEYPGSIEVPNLAAGKYIVVVENDGNDNYTFSAGSAEFEVIKATPEISAEALDILYGQTTTVTVTVSPNATGTVSIIVNGKKYTADIEGTTATATIEAADIVLGENNVNVIFDGDGNYTMNYNSTTFMAYDNVVTNDTFFRYFDENGILLDTVPFDELIFRGSFSNLTDIIVLNRPISISGSGSTLNILNGIGLRIVSEKVLVSGLLIAADGTDFSDDNDGAAVYVKGGDVTLKNVGVLYKVPVNAKAYGIYVTESNGFKLIDSVVSFQGNESNTGYQYGLRVYNSNDVLISGNQIVAQLPARDVDYTLPSGIGQDLVLAVGIQNANNLVFTQNEVKVEVIGETAWTTLDGIMVYGASNLQITNNNITLTDDENIGVGYYQAVDLYNFDGYIENNTIVVNTTTGIPGSGTANALQLSGPFVVVVNNNDLTAISNGPSSGIFTYNWAGRALLTVMDNNIYALGSGEPGQYDATTSGIELQVENAVLFDNIITVESIEEYNETLNVFGISNVQYSDHVEYIQIIHNSVYSDGKYAVLINYARDSFVSGNFLIAYELYGDEAVHVEGEAVVKDNFPAKLNLTISVEDIKVGEDAIATITANELFTGEVILTWGIEEIPVTLTDGIGSFSLGKLPANVYNVGVYYDGSSYFPADENTTNFTVSKFASEITIKTSDVVVDQNVGVTIVIPGATGNITLDIDGNIQELALENGVATATIEKIASGEHYITVAYDGDDNLDGNQSTYEFNVSKSSDYLFEAGLLENAVEVYETAYVIVTLPDDASDKIKVYVNGTLTAQADANRTVSIPLNILPSGKYAITVTYADAKYDEKSIELNLTVERASPELYVEVEDITVADVAVIHVYADELFNGTVTVYIGNEAKPLKLTDGYANLTLGKLPAENYTVQVKFAGDDLFTADDDEDEFTVSKLETEFIITFDTPVVDEDLTINISLPGVSDKITLIVDGYNNTVTLEDGKGSLTIPKANMTAGDHYFTAIFDGNGDYEPAYEYETFTIEKQEDYPFDVNLTIDEITVGENLTFNVTLPEDANGIVTVTVDDEPVTFENVVNGKATVTIPASEFTSGEYNTIEVTYADDKYGETTVEKDIYVNKLVANLTISAGNITIGENAVLIVTIPGAPESTYVTVELLGEVYDLYLIGGKDSVSVSGLGEGTYTAYAFIRDDPVYKHASAEVTFSVTKVDIPAEDAFNVTTPENATAPEFKVTLPEDATGYLLLDINGTQTFVPLVNGTATARVPEGFAPGNYSATVTYTGDDKYDPITTTQNITVASNVPDNAFTIPDTAKDGEPLTYAINLPSDAKGYLEVDVDGTKHVAALVNGSASITVPGLSAGSHNVTVSYTGDGKYSPVTKSVAMNVPAPVYKITNNNNVAAIYSAGANYKVLITKDGKAVGAGESVTFNFNGKTYTVKTDSKGYATLNLNTKVKVKTYTVTAEYKGVKVSNKVTIKHVIKAKNVSVKKSKKVNKIKVKTNKVNGKFLKGKKLTLKLKGKKIKAKINKKGVATFKVKKSVLKKLKVGKKYKYTVSYGKDKVTKKVKVKR